MGGSRRTCRVEIELEGRAETRRAQHAEPVFENRSTAFPTARIDLRSMSFRPSEGVDERPVVGSAAMALMVKSRRARSAVMSSTKLTASGRRPSEYVLSPRSVVTS